MQLKRPDCAFGKHWIADDVYYWVVNPEGGYGRPEALCCEPCVKKPEFDYVRKRLIECAGAKELE